MRVGGWREGIGAGLAALACGGLFAASAEAAIPGGTLDPSQVAKYQAPLVKPPTMPRKGKIQQRGGKNIDYYEIAVRQFEQQILPPGLPQTTVWSYGPEEDVNPDGSGKTIAQGGRFHYPALTVEAKWKAPVRVKWINGLVRVDEHGDRRYLPHLLPVDQTLHWANPVGPRDSRGFDPAPYTGPVPIVTHVHGAHVRDLSDGYPEAWYLPDADDLPASVEHATGTFYDFFKPRAEAAWGQDWEAGSAVFQYPNDQNAATLWYHDHTLGMTRLNVYAGPAGFWLLRGGPGDEVRDSYGGDAKLPGPAPGKNVDPFGDYYEIPLAIQDRSFNADGSLFFPDSRSFFDGFTGPFIPESDMSPIWNPEFFGNMMVVNGQTWPVLEVEPRRYRFRMLNGSNSRFLMLKLVTATDPDDASTWQDLSDEFVQIGADGGFLPQPQTLDRLLLGLAERADVLVDFSQIPVGTELYLVNVGPDEPFGGGEPGADFDPADPASTGQVMKLVVRPLKGRDRSTPAHRLVLPARHDLHHGTVRRVSLNELDSGVLPEVGPRAAMLGTVTGTDEPQGIPFEWASPISEHPHHGAVEDWEIYNFTADAHPIHLHLVQFQVLGREAIGGGPSVAGSNAPLPGETGEKDTVVAYPGEVTRLRARFDLEGLYVWHCHIIDHEDNEMMRPYFVGDPTGYPSSLFDGHMPHDPVPPAGPHKM